MSSEARRRTFPLKIAAPDSPDIIATLQADGSWSGNPEKLKVALERMQGKPGSLEPLIMWLVLREMTRDS